MSTIGQFVADPNQPLEAGIFAEYYNSLKEPVWRGHEALSYPVADLGIIPLLQVVKALPHGRIDFAATVSEQGIVGEPQGLHDMLPTAPQNDRLRRRLDEMQAYAKLAHAALSPSIARVAADYRERMDLGPLDINVGVAGAKELITKPIDLTDESLDDAHWPHLDIVGLWYFASIGKSTWYWPGRFNLSRADVEDDHEFYQAQIDAQKIATHSLPENSLIAVDKHFLHSIPEITADELPTDRFFASFTPNHSTPLKYVH